MSALSVAAVVSTGQTTPHVIALGSLEALGALLFLMPRLLRTAAGLLLVTLTAAIAAHAVRGQFPGALLVYAAASSSWPSTAAPSAGVGIPRPSR